VAPSADTEAMYQRAFEAYRRGEAASARGALIELLALRPTDARALLLLGVVTDKKTEPAVAVALVEQAVALDPTDASAWYNLGVYEGERSNLERALDCYQRAVALDPLHIDALGNGCELLRRLEHFETALEWADRRLALGQDNWSSHLNRGVCLFHLMRWQEAEAAMDRARQLGPDRPIVEWERFPMMLFQKRFAEAWDAFEHRFEVGHLNGVFAYPFDAPLWKGEPLAGKHIVIHNEQGLGDQLMFACALGEVVAQAKRTTVVVAPTLVDLFKASFPGAEVLPALYGRFAGDHPEPYWLKSLPKLDYQAPIGSLMAVLRSAPGSLDHPHAYLRPSDAARSRWKDFNAGPGLKVGVCWASNPALFRMDSARRAVRKSMQLEAMAPLADLPGVNLVSVLNWTIDPPPKAFAGRLQDLSTRLVSLDETAALIERLDLVITVDTAAAHLAGALGKVTWVLLHEFPDCRWELTADASYWYPNMRLFRQPKHGDWASVVGEVKAALKARTRQKAPA
jgi:tetratricopeptide (TPR) repeat protein